MSRLDDIKKNRNSVFGSFTLADDVEWLIEQVGRLETAEKLVRDVYTRLGEFPSEDYKLWLRAQAYVNALEETK